MYKKTAHCGVKGRIQRMKKKLVALALAALLTVPTVGAFVYAQENAPVAISETEKAEEMTVYLSDSGNDENDGLTVEKPVATLKKAIEVLGKDGGHIKIVGTFEHKDGFGESEKRGHITLSGYDGSATLIYTKTWAIGGDTTIENINWRVNANSIYLLAKG